MLTLLNVLSRCIIVDRCVGNFVCIYLQLCAEGKLEGSNTTEFNEDRLASIVRNVYQLCEEILQRQHCGRP